jgi:hypothetical protein
MDYGLWIMDFDESPINKSNAALKLWKLLPKFVTTEQWANESCWIW